MQYDHRTKLTLQEKYTAESSRLQVESQRQLERLEDIVQAVCSAAESVADSRGAGSKLQLHVLSSCDGWSALLIHVSSRAG